MKLLIALWHRFELWMPPEWLAPRLRTEFPQLEVVQIPNYDLLADELMDAEIAIAWSIRPEQFRIARKLRWIHSTAAAVHQLIYPEIVESDVILTNARSVHGPVVAEHALALMISMAKRIPSAVRFQLQKTWGQEKLWQQSPRAQELRGSTVCVVGFGAIGREVAERCAALGMRVVVVREHAHEASPPAEKVYPLAKFDEAAQDADFVVIALPVTSTTKGFFNAERLAALKTSAYVVNVGRGVLIDELALIEALKSRRLGGAALDVFGEEPLPPSSELWTLENVLVTPHVGSMTEQLWERHYELISENIRRYLAGEPLLGVVDKRRGY